MADSEIDGMNVSDLNYQLRKYCQENIEDEHCVAIRLANEITFDDVDNTVGITRHSLAIAILGTYLPAMLAALGIIGNTAALCMLLRRRRDDTNVYLSFIVALNLIYLCSVSLTQVLEAADIIQPIIYQHLMTCMFWPPLKDLMSHIHGYTVAVLAHSITCKPSFRQHIKIRLFMARLKCLSVIMALVYINFHSTLLRELTGNQCKISAKARTFYRHLWPWLRLSCCYYMPWVLAVAMMLQDWVRKRRDHNRQINSVAALCWLYILSTSARVALLPYQYSLMKLEPVEDNPQSPSIVYLQLSRHLCATSMHALSAIPILVAVVSSRDCSSRAPRAARV